jgi:pyrimidine operon attenuation protein/uracil phosphoribosyltransferase
MTNNTKLDVSELIDKLVEDIRVSLPDNALIIGIQSGGAWLAEILHDRLGISEPSGSLDISFYRDDFSRIGFNPKVESSNLPSDIDDRPVLLVDDVLQTGRTVRAAMNEIFDYGRPASIRLCVLVQRNGRELPIQADYTGIEMELAKDQYIKLDGPENLSLHVGEARK